MEISRTKARSKQTLDRVAFTWTSLPGSASDSDLNIPQRPSDKGGVSSNTQDPGDHLTTSLAAGNKRQPAVCKYLVDCLSCPDLSRSLEVKPNIIGRIYSSVTIKSHEVHRKIRNGIYLLTCKNCGI